MRDVQDGRAPRMFGAEVPAASCWVMRSRNACTALPKARAATDPAGRSKCGAVRPLSDLWRYKGWELRKRAVESKVSGRRFIRAGAVSPCRPSAMRSRMDGVPRSSGALAAIARDLDSSPAKVSAGVIAASAWRSKVQRLATQIQGGCRSCVGSRPWSRDRARRRGAALRGRGCSRHRRGACARRLRGRCEC